MAPSMAFGVVECKSTRVTLNGPTSFDLAQFEQNIKNYTDVVWTFPHEALLLYYQEVLTGL